MKEKFLNFSLHQDPEAGKTQEEKKHIADTWEHIEKVRENMNDLVGNIRNRSNYHDQSKLKEPELTAFAVYGAQLNKLTYGSPEYFEALNSPKFRIGLDHHYANNSHHPEYYPNGVLGMSLLDILEMLADWKAAGERTNNGNLKASLEYNKKRFNIPDELHNIIVRTAEELGWL